MRLFALQDPTRFCYDICGPLFFLVVWCMCGRRHSLSQSLFLCLSLSLRRWGNTKPLVICVSPCVFFFHGCVLPLRPARPAPHLHPGIAPAPVFFVRVRRYFDGAGGFVFFFSPSLSFFLTLSLSLSISLATCAEHAYHCLTGGGL